MTEPLHAQTNPHFDEGLRVWSDDYSGRYEPPPDAYAEQFDDKWRLVLEDGSGEQGFNDGPGVRTDDESIEFLVSEWTGTTENRELYGNRRARKLDTFVDASLIEDQRCVDVGCGNGRWTRVMQRLGASEVLSIDASAHALESVRRFNPDVLEADVMNLTQAHPHLVGQFRFGNLWGVAHHTHDPRLAFSNAAALIGAGGAIYLMVYSPEGMHNSERTHLFRSIFRELDTNDERIEFARAIYERKWQRRLPLSMNVKNALRNILGRPRWGRVIELLDDMMPWYNWTIPLEVAKGWMRDAGFEGVTVLNAKSPNRVAHHLLGTNKTA